MRYPSWQKIIPLVAALLFLKTALGEDQDEGQRSTFNAQRLTSNAEWYSTAVRDRQLQLFVFIRVNSWLKYEPAMTDEFDLQPNLKGELIELRPLVPEDWEELFGVASDPLIWEQHPESDRHKEDVFRTYFRGAMECGGAFAIIDKKTHEMIGSTRFFGYDPEKSDIEIGWTFLARKYWGGKYNRELKQLMLDHAFQFVENVVFLVGENNVRSQRATEKIGAIRDGMVEKTDRHGRPTRSVRYIIRRKKDEG